MLLRSKNSSFTTIINIRIEYCQNVFYYIMSTMNENFVIYFHEHLRPLSHYLHYLFTSVYSKICDALWGQFW